MQINLGPYPEDYKEERKIEINIDKFDQLSAQELPSIPGPSGNRWIVK
jgi:hypothetical protein